MYQDLSSKFLWTQMKREVAQYGAECDICNKVKVDHLRSTGPLQPLSMPSWKWEDISLDFIVGLPTTTARHDSIWVIVDRLTKTAHFIAVNTHYTAKRYAELFFERVVSLHGVPKTIVSDRGSVFVSRSWEQLHASMGRE